MEHKWMNMREINWVGDDFFCDAYAVWILIKIRNNFWVTACNDTFFVHFGIGIDETEEKVLPSCAE